MSRMQAQDFARENSPSARSLSGLVRRVAISLTRTVLWQLKGYKGIDGGETFDAEPFSGVGFYARPLASDNAEAITVQVGDARHTVIVACRNEHARRAIVDALNGGNGLAENEAVFYTRASLVHIKSDGTIEARTPGGAAVPIATKADLDAVVAYLKKQFSSANGHVHATPSGPTTAITESVSLLTPGTCPTPQGTQKFKAE